MPTVLFHLLHLADVVCCRMQHAHVDHFGWQFWSALTTFFMTEQSRECGPQTLNFVWVGWACLGRLQPNKVATGATMHSQLPTIPVVLVGTTG